ncbi:hypothetical protein PVL30_003380 [Lodderomyces elongisporus]|uniref:uncharacterized protein n=1 Tax=Lodderomyces elongisporus TaxID=36914 RepID=UPI002923AB7E|nr:uncharacterized protein PVL30_003380 [Lodderomyces elongisporus]WLF79624.1 hypothetical protein PVL30_003380 [Lodderomyces elongisporus]
MKSDPFRSFTNIFKKKKTDSASNDKTTSEKPKKQVAAASSPSSSKKQASSPVQSQNQSQPESQPRPQTERKADVSQSLLAAEQRANKYTKKPSSSALSAGKSTPATTTTATKASTSNFNSTSTPTSPAVDDEDYRVTKQDLQTYQKSIRSSGKINKKKAQQKQTTKEPFSPMIKLKLPNGKMTQVEFTQLITEITFEELFQKIDTVVPQDLVGKYVLKTSTPPFKIITAKNDTLLSQIPEFQHERLVLVLGHK